MSAFDISIEGFSGPLDLLCTLVDTGQFAASRIKVRKLVHIYGLYLAQSKHASVDTLAEFFYLAAGLLLSKTKSLLPSDEPELTDDLDDLATEAEEEALMEALTRYRPYRAAAGWLAEQQSIAERSFRRGFANLDETENDENAKQDSQSSQLQDVQDDGTGDFLSGITREVPPKLAKAEFEYDIGDVYFLARVWWGLFERWHNKKGIERRLLEEQLAAEEGADWDGFAAAVPDEALIENRIAELEVYLAENDCLSLRELCAEAQNAKHSDPEQNVRVLVVTLLALLEMCRMGKAAVQQDVLFGDVKITVPVSPESSGAQASTLAKQVE